VDNHVRILLGIKKYTQNTKERSDCPEATVGLKQRTFSCPQDRLRIGGPKTGDSPLPDTLQLQPTTPSSTPVYNYSPLLRSTEPTTDYHERSTYQVYYYNYYYYCRLPISSPPTEPRTPRSIASRTPSTVQEYQPSSAPSSSYSS
jgi:hypothetical protein